MEASAQDHEKANSASLASSVGLEKPTWPPARKQRQSHQAKRTDFFFIGWRHLATFLIINNGDPIPIHVMKLAISGATVYKTDSPKAKARLSMHL